jgi:hypothetical protein
LRNREAAQEVAHWQSLAARALKFVQFEVAGSAVNNDAGVRDRRDDSRNTSR